VQWCRTPVDALSVLKNKTQKFDRNCDNPPRKIP
jgi:hypothetical protein